MKMKKILALVMALVLVLSLAACQNSSGSTTGGESHWHPPVTPAPVPVVVIPPKTGDMTIWQSILHFLGIR